MTKLTEEERQRESKTSTAMHGQALKAREDLLNIEKEVKNINNELNVVRREKERVDAEKEELIRTQAKLELDISDSRKKIGRDKDTQDKLQKRLAELEAEIEKATEDLDEIKPQYQEQIQQEQKIQEQLTDSTRQVNQLYAKQGRKSQFKSVKERDTFIKKEIKQIDEQIKAKKAQVTISIDIDIDRIHLLSV